MEEGEVEDGGLEEIEEPLGSVAIERSSGVGDELGRLGGEIGGGEEGVPGAEDKLRSKERGGEEEESEWCGAGRRDK